MVNEQELNDIQINTPCGSTKRKLLSGFLFLYIIKLPFQ